ncbi:hypothetical protein AVEN_1636-1 [Araneus ventricosus]|uniref:Uncharacterized protein n=1 Tax=Araneus ventricosus TaxID=182803 RepID=A0A4Y2UA54_ARAVE|nr:hypothetical protein AVEN_1636-1 [Araneus ventricosus]
MAYTEVVRHGSNYLRKKKFTKQFYEFTSEYCYEHGKSLRSNVSLMVGKRVLQGYVWEYRRNGAIDLRPWRPFWRLDDKFGEEMWDLKSTRIFLRSLLGAEIRIYPDDSM